MIDVPTAAQPFESIEKTLQALDRLEREESLSPDEIEGMSARALSTSRLLTARATFIQFALTVHPLDRVLDAGTWLIGIAGFVFSVLDFSDGGLSLWGWFGLGTAITGLFVAAGIWQVRISQIVKLRSERADIRQWRIVLHEVTSAIERRMHADA